MFIRILDHIGWHKIKRLSEMQQQAAKDDVRADSEAGQVRQEAADGLHDGWT
jgi:hypothetical protein